LGHATFLTKGEIQLIQEKQIAIELCLTSNIL
jgi:cytosine/adenosine deaminase-related metal-dependent hydrolase